MFTTQRYTKLQLSFAHWKKGAVYHVVGVGG
jgi:hypothetical protein